MTRDVCHGFRRAYNFAAPLLRKKNVHIYPFLLDHHTKPAAGKLEDGELGRLVSVSLDRRHLPPLGLGYLGLTDLADRMSPFRRKERSADKDLKFRRLITRHLRRNSGKIVIIINLRKKVYRPRSNSLSSSHSILLGSNFT